MPWQLPMQLGAPDDTAEVAYQSLLDAYAGGWDTSDDTELAAELQGEAYIVSMIWAINERWRNQAIPLKMIDVLRDWEKIMNIIPRPDDSLVARRRVIAARLKGTASNTASAIESIAQEIFGAAFVALALVPDGDIWWHMPGISPGPPGMPFVSNRLTLAVHISDSLPRADLVRRRATLFEQLGHVLPSYVTYEIGVGDGTAGNFIAGQGIAGLTII